jgi:hypothetical protein
MLGGGIILVLAGVWVIARNFFASGSGPPLAEVLLVSPVYYLVGGAAIGGAIGYLRARKRPKASAETPVRPDPR